MDTPKDISFCETASSSCELLYVQIVSVVFAVGNDKKEMKGRYKKRPTCYISRIREEVPCETILTKFCIAIMQIYG